MSEPLRRWTETAETFFLEVIFEQRRGRLAAVVRGMLHGLSHAYRLAIKISDKVSGKVLTRDVNFTVKAS
jgi:hypothetical protein